MTSRQPTNAYEFRIDPPAPRSGLVVRAVFGMLMLGVALELVVVAGLMGYTLLRIADDGSAVTRWFSGAERRAQPMAEAVAGPEVNVWDHHGPLTVLLVGLDADDCVTPEEEQTDSRFQRADTILLVRVDPQRKRAAMMSIPRDLYVSVRLPNGGMSGRKINTANSIGEESLATGGGAALLMSTISENLGIPVHRYARIDFSGFKSVVEAIDGIDIDVPPSPGNPAVGLYDPEYPDGHCGTMVVDFKPGPQHMDGDRALQYARSRKSTSDYDRSRRQMQVLLAIRTKVLTLGVLPRLPQLLPAVKSTITTDFTAAEILSLARTAMAIGPEDIVTFQIDQTMVYDELLVIDNTPQAVLRLQATAFAELRERFLNIVAPTPTPSATPSATP